MPRKLLTQGILRFADEDGQAREVGIRLYSDETFQLMGEAQAQAEKAKLMAPTNQDLSAPSPQGKRMPNGLWNSSVPLPGHEIVYAEAEVKRR